MSMIPWVTMALASYAADYLNPIAKPGEPGYTSNPKNHFRLMYENDSAFNKDRNYSHGTRFDYARNICPHAFWGLSLTQNIYTPETHTDGAVMNEQPYAGYLALGAAYMYQGENVGLSTELQIGTTGKPSFAQDSQWFVHTMGDMEQWDGWGAQIESEPTVQLSNRQDWRLAFLESQTFGAYETDAVLYTREQVGTVYISAGVGLSLRWGHNLPDAMQVNGNNAGDYSVGLIRKSNYKPEEMSWFIVGNVYTEYVARDFSIDGGVFHHHDQTCSRKPWQVEGQLGVGVVKDGIHYYAGAIYHSLRYRQQSSPDLYGTFAISFHW